MRIGHGETHGDAAFRVGVQILVHMTFQSGVVHDLADDASGVPGAGLTAEKRVDIEAQPSPHTGVVQAQDIAVMLEKAAGDHVAAHAPVLKNPLIPEFEFRAHASASGRMSMPITFLCII